MNTASVQGAAAKPARLRRLASTYGTLIGLLLIVVIFTLLRPSVFLNPSNLRNILEQTAILAIVAFVQTIVMVVGDFDLSVGAMASLSGVVTASLLAQGLGLVPVLILGLLFGVVAGAFNGLLVAYLQLSAFVATLATMTTFRGVALWYTDGSTLFSISSAFLFIGGASIGPVPVPVLLTLAVLGITWVTLSQTTLGRRWYSIGGNPEASFLSGIGVRRLRLYAFVASGLGASLAGIVLTSRLASAHPLAGEPLMLTSIAAVFLGMTMFKEGQPNIPGTFFGVLIVGVLSNGLNILQVNSYVQEILTGAIIIAAVVASGLARRRS